MPKMVRNQRTNEDLNWATDRLFYEWKMLVFCTDELQNSQNQLMRNALIESGAIHSRILMSFFYPYSASHIPKNSDSIANDFFQQLVNEQKNLYPSKAAILEYEELGGHADKQIAHIVYKDGKNEPYVSYDHNTGHYEWNFAEITNELQPIIEKFISMVSKDFLGNRWKEELNYQQGPRWENLKLIVKEKT